MSYVVNDDIPKSCSKCPQRTLYHGINVCLAANKMKVNVSNKCRHENCLLIEIPTPHGRLIDADTVEKRLQKYWYEEYPNQEASYHRAFMDSNACVKDLPTIIEAEVSEE